MRASLPISLVFFAVTGVVFVLQTIPLVGIFFMLVAAAFWSVFLVNAGMIGVAAEATFGRVSRWWLLLPLAFYGGYLAMAAKDRIVLNLLSTQYDAANAGVTFPFDATRQALNFTNDRETGAWLTQIYGLPVAYSTDTSVPEGYRSYRMMDVAFCSRLQEMPGLFAASVQAFKISQSRFCSLSMPERPELPLVQVTRKEEEVSEWGLPVTRATTTIAPPGGASFKLLWDGVAAPLSWMPKPIVGCWLNSAHASWDCTAEFKRDKPVPIASGETQYRHDLMGLARALGMEPIAIESRKGADAEVTMAKLTTLMNETLTRQLANVDAMVQDPVESARDRKVDAVIANSDALASRADAIMEALERGVAVAGTDPYKARDSGRVLATLVASLPREKFVSFGPRLLALYSKTDDKSWLWDAGSLLRRLGDLGTEALPYLVSDRALSPSVDMAGVEGLCRIGSAGRSVAEPVLASIWTRLFDRASWNDRASIFVAMRRIGISPSLPPQAKQADLARLQSDWADISPQSPPRVCAIAAEASARQEEKAGSRRHSNLD